jgi:hypothetical protein
MDWGTLLGEDSSFTNLSKDEKDVLKQIFVSEAKRREKASSWVKIREVVDIKTWLESEYFVGPDCIRIYDYWKELIAEVFDSKREKENRINEIIISGSLGVGKSTCAELIMMRRLYELSCYKNINALFELMLKTHITFLYFSVNKAQAERTGYGEMMSWIDSSPYFQECFLRNKNINSLMLFPENILVAFGSGTQDSIGMSVMGSILDEANFFKGSESVESSKVAELYASIVNRSNSRFIIKGGTNYSLNILVSSSTHESSFTEQRIAQAKDNPNVLVRCPTQWEVKPGKFSGKFFYVCKGTNYLDPFIINSVDDVNQYRLAESLPKGNKADNLTDFPTIDAEIKTLPEFKQGDFLTVPIELKNGFESNIIKSLQDMGGVSVAPVGRLFSSKPVYLANCRDYLRHPFISESITISTGDSIRIQDYLRQDFMFSHITRPRYLHIDQSLVNDCTGIASVYVKEIVEVDNLKKPIIGVDFMLRIEPPKPPKRIAIYKIRDFIVYLNVVKGLKLGKVTYDIFNSEESRQILEEMGYSVGYQSVDRNDKAYVDTVTLLYEERIEMYDYTPFREEIFTVVHDRKRRKIDHTKTSCFLGDTEIKLLDGITARIEDLVGREGLELYGCLPDGTIVPTVASKVFKTKDVSEYVRVTLDNGKVIRCTPEHRFMLRDGTYKEAQLLTPEDSLMPLYYDYNGKLLKGYERIKDSVTGKWRYPHAIELYGGGRIAVKRWLRSMGVLVEKKYNPRIVSVERVFCESAPVYDIEVPLTSNFALGAGIFVHNSKDVSDAFVGAVENALSTDFVEHNIGDGIGDFLKANKPIIYDMYGGDIYKTRNVDELIDAEINRMMGEIDIY